MADINPAYQKMAGQIREAIEANESLPSVQLQQFFNEKTFQKLINAPYTAREDVDMLHHRYEVADLPKEAAAIINSKEVLAFLTDILNRKVTHVDAKMYAFAHKAYMILHDEAQEEEGVDMIIDCSAEWDGEWGGNVVYVDGSGDYNTIPPVGNSLFVAKRSGDMRKFIQYVNHYAEGKRFLLMGTIR